MSLEIESTSTALILIDLQHGIVGLPVQPHAASAVVERCRTLAAAFRSKDCKVVYARVDLNNMLPLIVDLSHRDPNVSLPPLASELVSDAGFQEGDTLVTKRHWGAFGPTELESFLHSEGIKTIVIAGIATNMGVESTARQAVALGFQVVFAEDACSSLDAAAHAFATQQIFPLMARVRSTQEIVDALD